MLPEIASISIQFPGLNKYGLTEQHNLKVFTVRADRPPKAPHYCTQQ
jgi:hypothetical protein